ncbi:hypothetical protein DMN91_003477 [Ooceraea biroi]|uniref:FAD dependent oxidoreductase domain-containing protein n=1 Tax=Ooceraea biroi TaxID=2015173 RepID=A0A3L8DS88_OOCBI|nr:hypothetical protein DMN91_003477 [Ooceraea biroi]
MRVAVVGAGVIGVTSAFAVKSAFPSYDVKIFADAFSPDTTGDGSAGLWSPYLLGDTPVDNITDKDNVHPEWEKLVYGFHKGYHFVTYTAEPTLLLPWLMKKFVTLGGKMERRNVKRLHELAEEGYDLIINCSGLGARELIADKTMTPIRGQIYKVKAPWTMQCFLVDDDDDCNYIIPNMHSVVLGGTHQEGDFDRSVREEDSEHIYKGCCRLMPSLQASQIIRAWVGLRPGRPRVRLECEALNTPMGREFKVIHNYGHGGSGVTLCWGCALDVVEMTRNLKVPKLNSKL